MSDQDKTAVQLSGEWFFRNVSREFALQVSKEAWAECKYLWALRFFMGVVKSEIKTLYTWRWRHIKSYW